MILSHNQKACISVLGPENILNLFVYFCGGEGPSDKFQNIT